MVLYTMIHHAVTNMHRRWGDSTDPELLLPAAPSATSAAQVQRCLHLPQSLLCNGRPLLQHPVGPARPHGIISSTCTTGGTRLGSCQAVAAERRTVDVKCELVGPSVGVR